MKFAPLGFELAWDLYHSFLLLKDKLRQSFQSLFEQFESDGIKPEVVRVPSPIGTRGKTFIEEMQKQSKAIM